MKNTSLAAVLLIFFASFSIAADPQSPTNKINLLNAKDHGGLSTWLRGSETKDPKGVFQIRDGQLHVSGDGFGYIATKEQWANYRLNLEYRWGKKTDGGKYVRNSGLLLHCATKDGGAGGTWPTCIECQLAQGCVGDLIIIRGKDQLDQPVPVSFTTTTSTDPSGKRHRWDPNGKIQQFPPTRGQLWWNNHDWDFKELLDTNGKNDVESKKDGWTRLECISDKDTISISVNGHQVNQVSKVFPTAGRIAVQCEGFELFVRTWEIMPLSAK